MQIFGEKFAFIHCNLKAASAFRDFDRFTIIYYVKSLVYGVN